MSIKVETCEICRKFAKYSCRSCLKPLCPYHCIIDPNKFKLCENCWKSTSYECHTCQIQVTSEKCVVDPLGNFCKSCWQSLVTNLEKMKSYKYKF